jgi:hypothetical protein
MKVSRKELEAESERFAFDMITFLNSQRRGFSRETLKSFLQSNGYPHSDEDVENLINFLRLNGYVEDKRNSKLN